MDIKLVFSDIDGTLLNSSHRIDKETREAIHKISEKGIPFILVSARMPDGIFPLQKELNITDPVIAYNGALVLDAADRFDRRETLLSIFMETNTVLSIYNFVRQHFPSVSFCAYSVNDWLVPSLDDQWIAQERAITGTEAHLCDFSDNKLANHEFPPINKVLCMGPPPMIDRLEAALKTREAGITLNQSKPTYLEISPASASKSAAIDVLLKHYGTKKEETMAFGDNFNDIDMLQMAGVGIAMGNAPDRVKEVADMTTQSNDHEGIKKALTAFGLI
ncbi:HAD family phosphatase [Sporolactobacillus sp. THM7-4]|nr:HAD family phosphatase [Sporolactobacillus sp. THM7-4]